jgi:hypothetical protein
MCIILEVSSHQKDESVKIVSSHASLAEAKSVALTLALKYATDVRGICPDSPKNTRTKIEGYVNFWEVGDSHTYYVVPSS